MKENLTICKIFPAETGATRDGGEWIRQTVLFETEPDMYGKTRKLAIDANGQTRVDKIAGLREGDKVTVTYVVFSREYNGRWYTNVNLANIEKIGGAPAPTAAPAPEDLP